MSGTGKTGIDVISGATKTIGRSHQEVHEGALFEACFKHNVLATTAAYEVTIKWASGVEGHLKNFDLWVSGAMVDVIIYEQPSDATQTTGVAKKAVNKNRVLAATNVSATTIMRASTWATDADSKTIATATASSNTLTVTADLSALMEVGSVFVISGSTGNDGPYTVLSIDYTDPTTTIVTEENFSNDTDDGVFKIKGLPVAGNRVGGGGESVGAFSAPGGGTGSEIETLCKPDTAYMIEVLNGDDGDIALGLCILWYEKPAE